MCQVNRLVQSKCLFNLAAATAADVLGRDLEACWLYYSAMSCQFCAHSNRFLFFFFFCFFHTLSSLFSGVDGFSVDVTTTMDIRDQNNKELAMRLVTNIQSGDVFYTDLNGFQVELHTDSVILLKTKGGTDDGKIKSNNG